jgi:hypothetical protein
VAASNRSPVDLVLYEGRNLETITQVSVIEAFLVR